MPALRPEEVPGFFDASSTCPSASAGPISLAADDLSGLVATMGGLFAASAWRLRRRLVVQDVSRGAGKGREG